MRFLFLLLIFCLFSHLCHGQFIWEPLVYDKNDQPIEDVLVETSDTLVVISENTSLFLPKDSNQVYIQAAGYKPRTLFVTSENASSKIILEDKLYELEEVMVRAVKLQRKDPYSFFELDKKAIQKLNLGQDIPMLLQSTPGVVAHSDAGNGIGYTYLRIRGSDQTRINVTINGIPINDSESHGVFWVNMPDISASAGNIQIHRGVGGSNNGAGAFGASVNIKTSNLERKPFAVMQASGGSFGAQKYSFEGGTGLLNGKFAFDGRISYQESDGFVDRASANLRSYYLSGTFLQKNAVWKVIHFGGKERTYQSWWGVPEAKLHGSEEDLMQHYQTNLGTIYQTPRDSINLFESDRRYNYYQYPNQVDDYGQQHNQLHYSFQKGAHALNAALHYTKGGGFFEEYKNNESLERYGLATTTDEFSVSDIIRRRWLDNHFYGLSWNWTWDEGSHEIAAGGAVNQYLGEHFGEIIWSQLDIEKNQRYYFSDATKNDAMFFVKAQKQFAQHWNISTDLQVRSIDYRTVGTDNDLQRFEVDENWLFFNPKVGLTYQPTLKNVAYASFAVANREPVRGDLINNPEQPLPERLYDLELGWRHKAEHYYFDLNYYYMHYQDQLVPTGDLNDVGAILRTNVPTSYRTGIELAYSWQPTTILEWYGSFNWSLNKIQSFDEVIFDYTNGFERLVIPHKNTDIAYAPSLIGFTGLKASWNSLEIDWQHRYTGRQFLDNTSNPNRALSSFYISNVHLSYTPKVSWAKDFAFQLQLNNIFGARYETFGYTYSYIFDETITENFLYPQATFNWMAGVKIGL